MFLLCIFANHQALQWRWRAVGCCKLPRLCLNQRVAAGHHPAPGAWSAIEFAIRLG
jgi:hypothetical protein